VQINTARQPLSNVNVRKALAKAVDRRALVRDITASISVPITSVIPPGMPGYQASLGQELGFDTGGARALLSQAGFADGQGFADLSFSFPATTANARRAEYLQAQWRQNLGIFVQLNSMDSNDYQQALKENNYDLAFAGWVADYPDPQDWFNALFSCKGAYNNTGYCKPSFDQIVARADAATTLNERLLAYNQAQALLIQDAPIVPLFARGRLALVKPWVQSTTGAPLPISPLDDYPGSLFLDTVQVLPH
jgi:oligopeptide transport system substrate-binding protein